MNFEGLTASDFDAYLEHKWASNVFNLERLQVKQKLAALGRQISPSLLSADGSLLECDVSPEHPTRWNHRSVKHQQLYFARNADARRELETIISRNRSMASQIEDPSPLHNHIFLSVLVDSSAVELALKLHSDASVDRENLLRKCHDYFQREQLLQHLQQLGEEFSFGLAGQAGVPVRDLDDDRLQQLISALPTAGDWLSICRKIDRARAIELAAGLASQAEAALSSLLPAMHHVAWRRDNDYVSVREVLEQHRLEQQSKGLQKQDKVRVVSGIFAGKTGVVQDVDSKGALKIMIGKMVVKLSCEDVVKA